MRAEQHKISCPYCLVGWAVIQISRDGSAITYDLDGYPSCIKCKRYFEVKRQLRLYGAPLEQQSAARIH